MKNLTDIFNINPGLPRFHDEDMSELLEELWLIVDYWTNDIQLVQ